MPEEILPGFYRLVIPLPDSPLKSLNSYIITGPTRNLIIDTGFNLDECIAAMQKGLNTLNIDLACTDIFITHLHADHFGLVEKLKTPTSTIYFNRPEAEILDGWNGFEHMFAYAAQNGFPEIELRNAFKQHPGKKFETQWVPEFQILQDGDLLEIGEYKLTCIETPGHSLGHICLYEADKKVLISGDHILGDISPNIQGWSNEQDMLKLYLNSLDKVYDLDVDIVLPGHRSIFTHFRERIDELKHHHMIRLDEILSILNQGPRHAYGVASKMHWDIKCDSWAQFPIPQKWFATGEAIAHLRYLEETRQILRNENNPQTTYSLVA
jgi:glyoxylase-like metal-dependent hydrolase (beta-lactamase superfamily II)